MMSVQIVICFAVSVALVMATMPRYIDYLRKVKFGQVEREEGLASHKKKGGTPTMGGLVFILAIIAGFYACNIIMISDPYALLLTYTLLSFGAIGFIDDYLIVAKNNNKGLKPRYKYALQSLFAIGFYLLASRLLPDFSTIITIPGTKLGINLHWFYPIFVYFMFTAESNAVNLTDGLDGLATGLMIIAVIPFMVFAVLQKNLAMTLYCGSILGGLVGFLIFNRHPAKIFMGDCGSLALGAILAALAMMCKLELLLIVIGVVPLIETLSVIIQVISFQTTGKRVFKMSPLHHHFELCGWSETKVVYVFYLVGLIAALLGGVLGVMSLV